MAEEERTINGMVVDIDTLSQDDHNFNKGTEAGKKLMKKSFEQFGAGRSILVDKDNRIIAGNKSQMAAIEAGIKKVRVIETTGDELIAVKRTDIELDSKEGRELALADNLTTQVNLSWDGAELAGVKEQYGIDLEGWGADDLLPAMADEAEAKEDNFDEDEDDVETICKPGDIWQLGEHRLMCGDSTSQTDVLKLMNGETADLWLTDPPYNVAVHNSRGMTIQNDDMASEDFFKFLSAAFKNASKVMSKGCPFYVWFASKEHINFEKSLQEAGLKIKQELIWNKNHFILGRAHYQWKHEPCFYGWKGDVCRYFVDSRRQMTVMEDAQEIEIDKLKLKEARALLKELMAERVSTTVLNEPKPLKNADHPTMKPVRLFGLQIQNSSKKDDIVLDSFGGSGTTVIACEQLGRKARLMEYDPHYCDVIIARWKKFTQGNAWRV